MKCQNCEKKEATIKYFENVNGNKKTFNLCYDCYKSLKFSGFSNTFTPTLFDIPEFVTEKSRCELCGNTFENYANTGLFGCPNCYSAFENKLDKLFLKIHGKNRHEESLNKKIGNINIKKEKSSSKINTKEYKIENLKQEIKDLIKEENYEKAAIIRDEIKKLENS